MNRGNGVEWSTPFVYTFSSIRSYSYSFPHTKNIVIRARELNEYSYDRLSF